MPPNTGTDNESRWPPDRIRRVLDVSPNNKTKGITVEMIRERYQTFGPMYVEAGRTYLHFSQFTEATSFRGSVTHVKLTSMLSFNPKLDVITLAKRLSVDSIPLVL
jgi:UV DNA damage repair endonuclease